MTKYSIVFFIAGVLGGLVLSLARRYFLSGWFWSGMALAFLLCLPNFLWQIHHGFISYQFLHHIHIRDVGEGRADGFLLQQLYICINPFAPLVCLVGLIAFLRSSRYRMLAWMYLIPLVLFILAKGRGYYMAAAYPMLLAMGSAVCERWLASLPRLGRLTIEAVHFTGLAVCGAYICAVVIPLASSGPLREFALRNNGDLREEIGWPELVKTVAEIRDSLTPDQRAHLGITTANYGEYGAIEILGPAYSLPGPIGTTNSEWLRGYPDPGPTTIIALGLQPDEADRIFTNCRIAGQNGNPAVVRNEESLDHPFIFVCGPPRKPWPEIWKEHHNFG